MSYIYYPDEIIRQYKHYLSPVTVTLKVDKIKTKVDYCSRYHFKDIENANRFIITGIRTSLPCKLYFNNNWHCMYILDNKTQYDYFYPLYAVEYDLGYIDIITKEEHPDIDIKLDGYMIDNLENIDNSDKRDIFTMTYPPKIPKKFYYVELGHIYITDQYGITKCTHKQLDNFS